MRRHVHVTTHAVTHQDGTLHIGPTDQTVSAGDGPTVRTRRVAGIKETTIARGDRFVGSEGGSRQATRGQERFPR